MDMRVTPQQTSQAPFARDLLGALAPDAAARVVAAAGDVALVIDRDGVIRDLHFAGDELAREGFTSWIDQPWVDIVTVESRPKVQQLLADAHASPAARWRELNHPTPSGGVAPIRYVALDSGQDGRVIAIGRDLRAAAALQQRLMQAQQEMERDYLRLRQAESRYRLLFQIASEAVVVVEAGSRRVSEVNPAAARLLGQDEGALAGQPFVKLIDPSGRDAVASLLAGAQAGARSQPVTVLLAGRGSACVLTASLFRQDRAAHLVIKLAPVEMAVGQPDGERRLLDVLQRLPDAFAVTDPDLSILAVNTAFLDLAQLATAEQATGQPLETFLGRPGIDLTVLIANLREHGSVRNFATVFRNQYDASEDVEVSGVSALDGEQPCFGFIVRSVGRRLGDQPRIGRELPRSVEQLTDLVGRVSLKEIVRETADLIEKLCIEAALELTGNNRASAAEILGLSRQSLYSKLHRYGLGNVGGDFEG